MIAPEDSRLTVDLEHRVHPGLELAARLSVGQERVVLFGPSGSGKTTLLRLIAGLERIQSGFIRLNGQMLEHTSTRIHVPPRRREIGLIFQEDRLFPHLNVEQNIRFGLRMNSSEAVTRAREVADLCGVTGLLGREPRTLSGGERQRVGLARAIAPRPRLLLCDEPVSALDLTARFQILERLRQVQSVEGIPMLYVTHSPAEALALGTRLLRWEGGQVVEEGAPLDLLSKRIPGERFENVWQARILHVSSEEMEIRLEHGPNLIVVPRALPVGSLLTVRLRADEIVLARGEITGLSVRNIVEGEVREVWSHDREAQVVVRAGGVDFVAGLTRRAVESLALSKGVGVSLVIKAKSIQVSENSC